MFNIQDLTSMRQTRHESATHSSTLRRFLDDPPSTDPGLSPVLSLLRPSEFSEGVAGVGRLKLSLIPVTVEAGGNGATAIESTGVLGPLASEA